jgi:hypothetical protein
LVGFITLYVLSRFVVDVVHIFTYVCTYIYLCTYICTYIHTYIYVGTIFPQKKFPDFFFKWNLFYYFALHIN